MDRRNTSETFAQSLKWTSHHGTAGSVLESLHPSQI